MTRPADKKNQSMTAAAAEAYCKAKFDHGDKPEEWKPERRVAKDAFLAGWRAADDAAFPQEVLGNPTIIVTGGRDYTDKDHVWQVLDSVRPGNVIVGDCPSGVDAFVRGWLMRTPKLTGFVVYEAHWETEGKAAGPLRNQRMVDDHPEALLIAFPGGRGTAHCTDAARKAGLVVLEVRK